MKFLNILTLLLVALVAYTSAQRCPGSPRAPSCSGGHDIGRRGRGCGPRVMWHYSARLRRCHVLTYLGCGGNNNRWCTRAACQQRCERR